MSRIEGAVAGQRGHNKTFRMCFVLMEKFPLPPDVAWQLLNEYNATCEPEWSVKELQHKFNDALRLVMQRRKSNGGSHGRNQTRNQQSRLVRRRHLDREDRRRGA